MPAARRQYCCQHQHQHQHQHQRVSNHPPSRCQVERAAPDPLPRLVRCAAVCSGLPTLPPIRHADPRDRGRRRRVSRHAAQGHGPPATAGAWRRGRGRSLGRREQAAADAGAPWLARAPGARPSGAAPLQVRAPVRCFPATVCAQTRHFGGSHRKKREFPLTVTSKCATPGCGGEKRKENRSRVTQATAFSTLCAPARPIRRPQPVPETTLAGAAV